MRILALACTLSLLVLVGAGSPSPSDAQSRSRCEPRGSKTVFKTRTARIFSRVVREDGERNLRHFACQYRRNFAFRLVGSDFPEGDEYRHFRIAGNYLAYEVSLSCAACDSTYRFVQIHDLRTGRDRGRGASSLGEISFNSTDITSLVLTRRGSAAWIVVQTGTDGDGNDLGATEVHAYSGRRDTLLDSGADVAARSLRLRGTTLSWVRGGARKTATLR